MSDKAHAQTDRLLSATEKRISEIYADAWKGLFDELNIIALYLDDDEATPNQRLKHAAEAIDDIVVLFVIYAVVAAEKSITEINAMLDNVYPLNYRYMADEIGVVDDNEHDEVVKPTNHQRRAYDRLQSEPRLSREVKKEVERLVKQGQTVSEMERRIKNLYQRGERQSKLISRTEFTRSENSARLDAMIEAKKQGIEVRKRWNSMYWDKRTRDSHVRLNGETQELEQPFSNTLQFPGDQNGPPEEVVSCRCWLTAVMSG